MGALLGISARTPNYSAIVSQLLASCENSPFAAQFVYNLMGPIFYELTMMAMPSEDLPVLTSGALVQSPKESQGIKVSTILKFLCFVYLESVLHYESTEDVFETLTFCNQYEVTELQEYCATSLKSFAGTPLSHRAKPTNSQLSKRICDYLVLFLGGRIPFYFNEEELHLLHSVFIETTLDVFYGHRSEFDIAQSGIWWVQRKIMIPRFKSNTLISSSRSSETRKCIYSSAFIALAISSGVNILAGGSWQCEILLNCVLLLSSAIWTWVNNCSAQRLRQQRRIILLLYGSSPDSVEGIITEKQLVSGIIRSGPGS